jgi:GTP-binding protein
MNSNRPLPVEKVEFKMGIQSAHQLEDWLKEHPEAIGIAFVGRSNVGKSSLINALYGKKTARVSNTPGRTQQVNIFEFKLFDDETPYYLYDVPGYGFAKVSKSMQRNWDLLMGLFFQYTSLSTLFINIQDSRQPFQKSDHHFMDFIKKAPFETYLAINKIDKLKKQKERAALQKTIKESMKDLKIYQQIFKISAIDNKTTTELEASLMNFLQKKKAESTIS